MKFLLRGIIQILWNLDLDDYILITTDGRVLHGNDAFSSETDLGAGLHAFTDLADNISIKCWNSSFTAENSCCVFFLGFSVFLRFRWYLRRCRWLFCW